MGIAPLQGHRNAVSDVSVLTRRASGASHSAGSQEPSKISRAASAIRSGKRRRKASSCLATRSAFTSRYVRLASRVTSPAAVRRRRCRLTRRGARFDSRSRFEKVDGPVCTSALRRSRWARTRRAEMRTRSSAARPDEAYQWRRRPFRQATTKPCSSRAARWYLTAPSERSTFRGSARS